MYITIQLLNTEAKNITEHSQREMVHREGNSKSGNTSISIVPCFYVKTLNKNNLIDSRTYFGSWFISTSSQQSGPDGRNLQQLVTLHLLSGSREEAMLSLAGCLFLIQSRMCGMVLPVFNMSLPPQLAEYMYPSQICSEVCFLGEAQSFEIEMKCWPSGRTDRVLNYMKNSQLWLLKAID